MSSRVVLRAGLLVQVIWVACTPSPIDPPDAGPVPCPAPIADVDAWLTQPVGDFPEKLSTIGLYADATRFDCVHPAAASYVPAFELWSNGAAKFRAIVVPPGAPVDVSNRAAWSFAPGTLFFKTFVYGTRPVETRVLRRTDEGWSYAAYLWNDDGRDAVKLDGRTPRPVPVTDASGALLHEVPSTLECRTCHESAADPVLGFDELRLAAPVNGGTRTQLEVLHEHGVLGDALERPFATIASSGIEREVLGWFEANCTHCHNGREGESSSFDLRHEVALENTIGQPTTASGSVRGIRIVGSDPESSVLYRAIRAGGTPGHGELKPMPPLGVQRADVVGIERIRAWIASLDGVRWDPVDAKVTFEDITLEAAPGEITEFHFVPGTDDEFLVLEKAGSVLHYELAGRSAALKGRFLAPDVWSENDCGLSSLAFDPGFGTNHHLYLGHCSSLTANRITRVDFNPDVDGYASIPATKVTIFEAGDPLADAPFHNVGAMGFEASGVMWALFGEKNRGVNAQLLSTPLGAVVRLVPGERGGATPATDNPFVGHATNSPWIAAKGLRSPWRGFSLPDGRLVVGDVGGVSIEEINLVTTHSMNFGWPAVEGPCRDQCTGFTDPVLSWGRSPWDRYLQEDAETEPTVRRVVWVAPGHRGAVDPYDGLLDAEALFGDTCTGWFRKVRFNDAGVVTEDALLGHLSSVSWAEQGPDGFIYVSTFGVGCKAATGTPPPGRLVRVRKK